MFNFETVLIIYMGTISKSKKKSKLSKKKIYKVGVMVKYKKMTILYI